MDKIFFAKLSSFIFLFNTATIYGAIQTPLTQLSSENTQNALEDGTHKMLQNEALIQADALLRYIHQIGLRIEKLQLKKDAKEEITETINGIREKLEKLKISHSLCIDSVKLARFITIIEALTEAIEGSLKNNFITMPTIDSHSIKRSQSTTAVNPQQLQKQLLKNTQRLKKFDSLISIINLNWFQRGYRVTSDAWNTPLYTFDSLGKADLYMSSILKRLIVYPSALGLVVYNINPKIIESIPLKGVRENLMKFKIWTGRTPHEEAKTRNDSYIPVEEEFIQEGFKTDGILLKTDESGFPRIEKITTNNKNSLYKLCGVNGEILTFSSEKDARNSYSYDSYKYAVTDNKNIFCEVKKSGPQSYKTVTQGIPVTIDNDKILQPLPQFTPQSPYRNVTTKDGTINQHFPIPTNWVQQSDRHHSTVEIGSQAS
ncbi:hypothetical protein K9K77_02025 [Candidatus Babeliales bacterium]|nr:hypothetical protein [Candidatus Babeliales bacterium]